nr:unnamed protein product [Digitaria exilis]
MVGAAAHSSVNESKAVEEWSGGEVVLQQQQQWSRGVGGWCVEGWPRREEETGGRRSGCLGGARGTSPLSSGCGRPRGGRQRPPRPFNS